MGVICTKKSEVKEITPEKKEEKVEPIRVGDLQPGKNAGRKRSNSNTSSGSDSSTDGSIESPRSIRSKDRIEIATQQNRKMIEMRINGKLVKVPKGITVYDACEHCLRDNDPGRIPPTFCFHPYLPSARLYQGKCGICEVENADTGELIRSCKTKVKENMSILTWGKKVDEHIKSVLKSKLASHPLNCPSCDDNGQCIFQELLSKFDISPADLDEKMKEQYIKNCTKSMTKKSVIGNNAVTFDTAKCLSCYRCIRVCEHVQGMSCQTLLKSSERNEKGVHIFRDIEEYHENMYSTDCIMCGQCSFVCPVGAISVNSDMKLVGELLHHRLNPMNMDGVKKDGKIIVAQIAPSVRVTLSEDFGLKPGAFGVRQIVSALHKVGFDYVFDTQWAADLTIMEEGHEFMKRIKDHGPWPMFTSCCPAWINLCEKHFPDFLPNISTCKSPQQMMGALIKSYWAEMVAKVDPKRVVVVSFMPCTAKKDELLRPQLKGDVDHSATTRELSKYLKIKKIDVEKMPETEFDDMLGESTGASNLFGVSGGVTEAVLRTVYEKITGKEMKSGLEVDVTRGFKKLKSTTVDVGSAKVKISVVHTAKMVREILVEMSKRREEEEEVEQEIHLIEMMSCPGGCIGGGGNPKFKGNHNTLDERRMAIYSLDRGKKIRKSHENPQVLKLYKDYLGDPGSEKAHKILHTHYTDRCDLSDKERGNKSLLI